MKRPRRLAVDAEIDTIPVLSVIVHLIPMLLLGVRFVQHAEVRAPDPLVRAQEGATAEETERQDREVVSVRVDADGFEVRGLPTGLATLACRGACAADTYDWAGLSARLGEARAAHRSEVVIAPTPEVSWEVVARVMDDARAAGGFTRPLLATP